MPKQESHSRTAPSRREFLCAAGAAAAGALTARSGTGQEPAHRPPNVLFIITDDQGYGDLGCHGNPIIHTPNLDRLHTESTRLTQFHVCPVCSPTRASIMTGRYNYRTGVVDTYIGRSLMHADEVTLAEVLGAHGYRTGIFGKWHLGDNYPLRAMDQGFQEALVHRGGGIGQPSDSPGSGYFNPVLIHNGKEEKHEGYCTDIFANAAMRFIEADQDAPFFCYLATNAPHSPLEIAEPYAAPYRIAGVKEEVARAYGMIANIDENVGRVLAHLDTLGLRDNTIVIFMTDNGSANPGGADSFNAGMRGWKGTVYEGGTRVPFFVRWPSVLGAGRDIDRIAAHIDLFPTMLDACGITVEDGVKRDGVSLMPLLLNPAAAWQDRSLFFQWHRGDVPEPFRQCAVRTQQYKLIDGKELYDLEQDAGEQNDIAAAHPGIVARLRAEYEAWYADVSTTRGYAVPRIHLGTPYENPVILTRQDWRGAKGCGDTDLGHWEVFVAEAGTYDISLRFKGRPTPREAALKLGAVSAVQAVPPGASECTFAGVTLEKGDAFLEASLNQGDARTGAAYVHVTRLSSQAEQGSI